MSQLLFFAVYSFAFWWGERLLQGYGFGPKLDPTSLSRVFFALTLSATAIGQSSARASDSTKGMASRDSIFALVDTEPAIDPTSTTGQVGYPDDRNRRVSVELRNVTFHYPSRPDVRVLDCLSCSIESGSTVAFCGASGSGKSSIIRLLERFYDCDNVNDAGIFINGVNITKLNLRWWRNQVGLVGQEPVLFQGTIAENIAYGVDTSLGEVSQKQIEDAAKQANAHDFISQFPDGYDTQVGGKGSQLSGGQKQRIAVARALIRTPFFSCSMRRLQRSTMSQAVVQAALDRLMSNSGLTCVCIAHGSQQFEMQIRSSCSEGRVVEEGNHEQLMMLKNGHYKHLASMNVKM